MGRVRYHNLDRTPTARFRLQLPRRVNWHLRKVQTNTSSLVLRSHSHHTHQHQACPVPALKVCRRSRVCSCYLVQRQSCTVASLPSAVDGRVLVAPALGHSSDLLGAWMEAETCFFPPNTACIDPAPGQRLFLLSMDFFTGS